MGKKKILLVSADPQQRLQLTEEERQIRRSLRSSKHREALEFEVLWVSHADDLRRELDEVRPDVVHFSGHGSDGLLLAGLEEPAYAAGGSRLAELLAPFQNDIQVVVLSACFSPALAESVTRVVDCVVGTQSEIPDEAAITFISQFYEVLADGGSVLTAVQVASAALQLNHFGDGELAALAVGQGVDAAQIFLTSAGKKKRDTPQPQAADDLLLIADLDAAPVELTVELMGALDELHRALGGGGLEIRTAHAGSAAAVEVPA